MPKAPMARPPLTAEQQQFVVDNLPLAKKLAMGMSYAVVPVARRHLTDDEIVSAGHMALTIVAARYDPSSGNALSTYLRWYVLSELQSAISEAHFLYKRDDHKIIPFNVLSLQYAYFDSDDGATEFKDFIPDHRKQDDAMPGAEAIENSLVHEDARTQYAVRAHFIGGLPYSVIGIDLEVTRERVRQIIEFWLRKRKESLLRDLAMDKPEDQESWKRRRREVNIRQPHRSS